MELLQVSVVVLDTAVTVDGCIPLLSKCSHSSWLVESSDFVGQMYNVPIPAGQTSTNFTMTIPWWCHTGGRGAVQLCWRFSDCPVCGVQLLCVWGSSWSGPQPDSQWDLSSQLHSGGYHGWECHRWALCFIVKFPITAVIKNCRVSILPFSATCIWKLANCRLFIVH